MKPDEAAAEESWMDMGAGSLGRVSMRAPPCRRFLCLTRRPRPPRQPPGQRPEASAERGRGVRVAKRKADACAGGYVGGGGVGKGLHQRLFVKDGTLPIFSFQQGFIK